MATTNLTTTGGLAAKMAVYYSKRGLSKLRENLVIHQFGEKKELPKNNGKQVNWFRRVDSAADTATITEGTVPSPITLSSNQVTAQLAQYGNFTQTSDLLEMTSIDNEIENAVDTLSFKAARTLDTLDRNVLDAGTTIQYGGAKTSLATTAAADVLNGAVVRNAVRALNVANAMPFGENFAWVIHPNNAYDLMSDTASGGWVNANTYVDTNGIKNGEIGKFFGAKFYQSTNVSSTASGTSGSATVYSTHLLSQGAFGVVEYDGSYQIYVKKSGEQDTSNPLNQYSTIGYKMTYAVKMLDENRQITVKVGSAN
jgi:N4-gp56 family major capsid protein